MRLSTNSSPIGTGYGLATPACSSTIAGFTPEESTATMWLQGAPLDGPGQFTLAGDTGPTHIDSAYWAPTNKTMIVTGNSYGAKPRLSEDPAQYINGIRPLHLVEKGTRLYSTTGAPAANAPHYLVAVVQFLGLTAGEGGAGSFMQVSGQNTNSSGMGHDYTAGPPEKAQYWFAGQGPAPLIPAAPLVDITKLVLMELLYIDGIRYHFVNGQASAGPSGQPLEMSFSPGNDHIMVGNWWDQYFPPSTLIYGCGWDMSGITTDHLVGGARANYLRYLQDLVGLELNLQIDCFGDSITYAIQLADPTTFYGFQAALLWAAASPSVTVDLRQEGGSGYTSSQILTAITSPLTSNVYRFYKSAADKDQIAMFQAGTNDILQLSPAATAGEVTAALDLLTSNYVAMIAWAKANGWQRVGLATIMTASFDVYAPNLSLRLQANAWIDANQNVYGYKKVDWSTVTLDDLVEDDDVHPKLEGHVKMGAAIYAAFA